MRLFLRRASLGLLLALSACKPSYENLQKLPEAAPPADSGALMSFRPNPVSESKAIYRCLINGKVLFKSFHLSGLLLFRQLEDGSARVLFTNEMGLTFFDFGWDKNDSFQVYRILPQLDKPSLIQMLREDLSAVLLREIHPDATYRQGTETIHRANLEKTKAYYTITDGKLKTIDLAEKKLSRTITFIPPVLPAQLPDSLSIQQHGAQFSIQTKRISDVTDQ